MADPNEQSVPDITDRLTLMIERRVLAPDVVDDARREIERLRHLIERALHSAHISSLFNGGAGSGDLVSGFTLWADALIRENRRLDTIAAASFHLVRADEEGSESAWHALADALDEADYEPDDLTATSTSEEADHG